jgi:hypothetical protein
MIEDHARNKSISILSKYCDMAPKPVLRRRLIWHAPLEGKRGIVQSAPKPPVKSQDIHWKNLNEQLGRQAYVVVLNYDIKKENFSLVDTVDGGEIKTTK